MQTRSDNKTGGVSKGERCVSFDDNMPIITVRNNQDLVSKATCHGDETLGLKF